MTTIFLGHQSDYGSTYAAETWCSDSTTANSTGFINNIEVYTGSGTVYVCSCYGSGPSYTRRAYVGPFTATTGFNQWTAPTHFTAFQILNGDKGAVYTAGALHYTTGGDSIHYVAGDDISPDTAMNLSTSGSYTFSLYMSGTTVGPYPGLYAQGNTGGTNQAVASLGTTQVSGSRIIMAVESGSVSSVTDSKGNSYSRQKSQSGSGFTLDTWLSAEGTAGGASHTVTINFSSSGNRLCHVQEICNAGAVDVNPSGTDSSSPWTLASGTLAEAYELLITHVGNDGTSNPTTFSESFGFTKYGEVTNGATYYPNSLWGYIAPDTSSVTPSFTAGSGTNAALITVGIKSPAMVSFGGAVSLRLRSGRLMIGGIPQ